MIERRRGAEAVALIETKIAPAILGMTGREIRELFDLREEVDLVEVSRSLSVVLGNNHPAMRRLGEISFR